MDHYLTVLTDLIEIFGKRTYKNVISIFQVTRFVFGGTTQVYDLNIFFVLDLLEFILSDDLFGCQFMVQFLPDFYIWNIVIVKNPDELLLGSKILAQKLIKNHIPGHD